MLRPCSACAILINKVNINAKQEQNMRNFFSLPSRSANDNVLNDSALKGSVFGADNSTYKLVLKTISKRCGNPR